MNRPATIGIAGGYGATGKEVASQLSKSGEGEILIGGRDLAKGKALAAELGGRVSAAPLDVLDAQSLDAFCRRCSIVVNCAGPVKVLEDRVAQGAFRAQCHYIDAAGMSLVKERMLPHRGEIEEAGLSFVISAGWAPGLTELVPAYAATQAGTKLESIESMTVFFSDSGEWSDNALCDAAWFLRKSGLDGGGYFRKGEWTRAKTSQAFCKTDLGDGIGSRRFAMFSTPELREVGRGIKDYDVFAYSYLAGPRNALAPMLVALLPLPRNLGVHLLRNVFRRNQLPVDGFVVARVSGHSQGRPHTVHYKVVYHDRRDYWMNGTVLSTAARMVSEGAVRAGVSFLSGAVDPVTFLSRLEKAGVALIVD